MITSFSVHLRACAHAMHSKDQLSFSRERACMPLHMYKHILPYMIDERVDRTDDQTRAAELP